MDGSLGTTNNILLVMAIVSVLEALLLIAMGVGGFLIYRRVMQVVSDLEARQVAPLREKVDAILTDVRAVTARVSTQTERVDHAIAGTIDRVDDTAERMKSTVREKVNQTIGVVRGIRAVVMSLLTSESRPKPPAPAAGTA
jgi:hypothetical protein